MRLGRNLRTFESAIGRLGDVLEAPRGGLGGSWEVSGRLWRLPWTILEAFLEDFLAS